ncbi:mitochondrial AAA ATPase [Colletotrichum tofieldiae]|uniref:Mitochondrial AAA ATPase n=1 Tax=Colletotrichum tofieldiae TaxID=708197 RepID=A0A166RTN2_9PEZI|nr:mitochondrial AAA ATPase [Colletotrichum tofieldiae]
MLFSEIYKSPRSPLSKFRLSMSQQPLTLDLPDYDPDLLSKDKVKQKEAVKRYLTAKVRNDWQFVWPPVASPPQNGNASPAADAPPEGEGVEQAHQETPEPQAEATATATAISQDEALETMESDEDEEEEEDSDAESVYSTVSEDPARFKPRLEWVSDLSDEDPPMSLSPFRFDSPDAIGAAVKASVADKRARRRRAVREEMAWNEGLACFEARRNAWTGARTRPSNEAATAVSDGSELSKDPSKELTAQKSKESQKSAASPASTTYPIETIVPLSAPLLPPGNPMRASITPAVYMSLYEKVIVHALTPSCPVNLSDMIRACVVGWKRDGEWPPKPSAAEPGIVAVRRRKKSATEGQGPNATRRMSFGFLGRGEKADNHDEGAGKGIRKSLQRVLGIGQHPASPASAGGNNSAAANGKDAAAV